VRHGWNGLTRNNLIRELTATPVKRIGGVFAYRWALKPADPATSMWLLDFFDGIRFFCKSAPTEDNLLVQYSRWLLIGSVLSPRILSEMQSLPVPISPFPRPTKTGDGLSRGAYDRHLQGIAAGGREAAMAEKVSF
jgi:hypothetical protein